MSEFLSAEGLDEGIYYIRVFGYNGSQADYALAISPPGGQDGDDAFEENDSFAEAAPAEIHDVGTAFGEVTLDMVCDKLL